MRDWVLLGEFGVLVEVGRGTSGYRNLGALLNGTEFVLVRNHFQDYGPAKTTDCSNVEGYGVFKKSIHK